MKMGKEVKIGLGVIGVLLALFGYVAWRRLADSRPPVALANPAAETAEGDGAPGEAGDGAAVVEAGQAEAGGNDMFSRLSRRKEEPAEEPAQTTPAHTGHDAPWRRDPPAQTAQSGDFSNPDAFSSRRRTAPVVDAEIKEPAVVEVEPSEPVAGEPRKLPDLELPAYARGRQQPVVEADEPPMQEEPARPSARRYGSHHAETEQVEPQQTAPSRLTIRTPVEVEEPVGTVVEVADEQPQPIARGTVRPPVRGVVAGADDVSNANAYDTRNTRPAATPRAMSASSNPTYNDRNAYTPATGAPPAGGPKNYAEPEEYGGPAGHAGGTPHRRGDKYVVQPNDSYWVISTRLYGQGGYYRALYEHNRAKYPSADKLRPGDAISAPELAVIERDYADLCPRKPTGRAGQGAFHPASHVTGGTPYKVREGDTLYDIARYELGKASRWNEIYELNRERLGDDFDYLPPGMTLMLPGEGGSPQTPHGQPGERYHTPGVYGQDRVTTRPGESPR